MHLIQTKGFCIASRKKTLSNQNQIILTKFRSFMFPVNKCVDIFLERTVRDRAESAQNDVIEQFEIRKCLDR